MYLLGEMGMSLNMNESSDELNLQQEQQYH
jgi:hypothetical protein